MEMRAVTYDVFSAAGSAAELRRARPDYFPKATGAQPNGVRVGGRGSRGANPRRAIVVDE